MVIVSKLSRDAEAPRSFCLRVSPAKCGFSARLHLRRLNEWSMLNGLAVNENNIEIDLFTIPHESLSVNRYPDLSRRA